MRVSGLTDTRLIILSLMRSKKQAPRIPMSVMAVMADDSGTGFLILTHGMPGKGCHLKHQTRRRREPNRVRGSFSPCSKTGCKVMLS